MTITCKICERVIRGRAATEEYNETTQAMSYVCLPCHKPLRLVAGMVDADAPAACDLGIHRVYPMPQGGYGMRSVLMRCGCSLWHGCTTGRIRVKKTCAAHAAQVQVGPTGLVVQP